jgi:hypothetical protein
MPKVQRFHILKWITTCYILSNLHCLLPVELVEAVAQLGLLVQLVLPVELEQQDRLAEVLQEYLV